MNPRLHQQILWGHAICALIMHFVNLGQCRPPTSSDPSLQLTGFPYPGSSDMSDGNIRRRGTGDASKSDAFGTGSSPADGVERRRRPSDATEYPPVPYESSSNEPHSRDLVDVDVTNGSREAEFIHEPHPLLAPGIQLLKNIFHSANASSSSGDVTRDKTKPHSGRSSDILSKNDRGDYDSPKPMNTFVYNTFSGKNIGMDIDGGDRQNDIHNISEWRKFANSSSEDDVHPKRHRRDTALKGKNKHKMRHSRNKKLILKDRDPDFINPDVLLKSLGPEQVIMNGRKLKTEYCRVVKFRMHISVPGCLHKEIKSRMCYGQCNSFFIPQVDPVHNDKKAFNSTATCVPDRMRFKDVVLDCPGTDTPKLKKSVIVIESCKCSMGESVNCTKKRTKGRNDGKKKIAKS